MTTQQTELIRWEMIDALETQWPGVKFWVSISELVERRTPTLTIVWDDGPTPWMVNAQAMQILPGLITTSRQYSRRFLEGVKAAFVRKFGAGSESLVEITNGGAYAKTLQAQKQFYEIAERRVIIRNGKIA